MNDKQIERLMKWSFLLFATLITLVFFRRSEPIKLDKPQRQLDKNQIPACKLTLSPEECANEEIKNQRIVIIGDIHGSLEGLQDILYSADVTVSTTSCAWKDGAENTMVVQVGDIVDRGPQALEAWECLDELQASAPTGSEVVRLLGNHDLWWLEGHFHMRNESADTIEKIVKIVDSMKAGVMSGNVMGSHHLRIRDQDILFTHSGIRPDFFKYLKIYDIENAIDIAAYINRKLTDSVKACGDKNYQCQLDDEVFEAGKDRGGSHIGGPFWTDFSVISKAAENLRTPPDMIQVVGHSAAHCYDPRRLGMHPLPTEPGCEKGLIRVSNALAAVCVDGGMYMGARSFLEISPQGRFRAWERKYDEGDFDGMQSQTTPQWVMRDLTAEVCD